MDTLTSTDLTAVMLTRTQVNALLLVAVSAMKMDPELRTPNALLAVGELAAAARAA